MNTTDTQKLANRIAVLTISVEIADRDATKAYEIARRCASDDIPAILEARRVAEDAEQEARVARRRLIGLWEAATVLGVDEPVREEVTRQQTE